MHVSAKGLNVQRLTNLDVVNLHILSPATCGSTLKRFKKTITANVKNKEITDIIVDGDLQS